jgi:two-component system, NtrC family, response regulator AtoC
VVPPLRERPEEVAPLARAFVAAACRRQGRGALAIDPRALRALGRYEWPGNIRELRNVAERAVLLCADSTITLEHLPADKMSGTFEMRKIATEEPAPPAASPVDLKAGIKARERQLIEDALTQTDGNQTRAAKLLGISRRTLISRIEDYGLPRPRGGRAR